MFRSLITGLEDIWHFWLTKGSDWSLGPSQKLAMAISKSSIKIIRLKPVFHCDVICHSPHMALLKNYDGHACTMPCRLQEFECLSECEICIQFFAVDF